MCAAGQVVHVDVLRAAHGGSGRVWKSLGVDEGAG